MHRHSFSSETRFIGRKERSRWLFAIDESPMRRWIFEEMPVEIVDRDLTNNSFIYGRRRGWFINIDVLVSLTGKRSLLKQHTNDTTSSISLRWIDRWDGSQHAHGSDRLHERKHSSLQVDHGSSSIDRPSKEETAKTCPDLRRRTNHTESCRAAERRWKSKASERRCWLQGEPNGQ